MNTEFGEVTIIRSNRRSVAVRVVSGGLEVRAPLRMSDRAVLSFLEANRLRILQMLRSAAQRRESSPLAGAPISEEELRQLAKQAKKQLSAKAAHFAGLMGVSYGRITIRAQKTRWGSCSSLGNLNFNCLLMLCPEPIQDYVVVHELAHRKQMNHSPLFWEEVRRIIPDYRQRKKWLQENGSALMERMER